MLPIILHSVVAKDDGYFHAYLIQKEGSKFTGWFMYTELRTFLLLYLKSKKAQQIIRYLRHRYHNEEQKENNKLGKLGGGGVGRGKEQVMDYGEKNIYRKVTLKIFQYIASIKQEQVIFRKE